jgi:hypothetical protein
LIDHLFRKTIGLDWYWYRVEWQARTAVHAHGVVKLSNDPGIAKLVATVYKGELASKKLITLAEQDLEEEALELDDALYDQLDQLVNAGEEARTLVNRYCNWLVNGTNPREGVDFTQITNNAQVPDPHPCGTRTLNELDNLEKVYEDLCNCCQRHICRPSGYCKNQNVPGSQCRFNYPFDLQEESELVFEEANNKVRAIFKIKRNDPYLNVHMKAALIAWKANIDFQIIFDYHAAVTYMAKYASKAERQSNSAQRIFQTVIQNASDEDTVAGRMKSIMIRTTERRDAGVGETCRMLSGWVHCKTSFKFAKVVLKVDQNQLIRNENGEFKVQNNYFFYYGNRLLLQDEYPEYNLTLPKNLIEFITAFVIKSDGLRPRHDSANTIVITWPNLPSTPNSPTYVKYCRNQLLKYAEWDYDKLALMDSGEYCQKLWTELIADPDFLQNIRQIDEGINQELVRLRQENAMMVEDELENDDWMDLSNLMPISTDDVDDSFVDRTYDWPNNPAVPAKNFQECQTYLNNQIKTLKAAGPHLDEPDLPHVDRSTLNVRRTGMTVSSTQQLKN